MTRAQLKGKNALVTGAGKRGGKEIALALGHAGFDVAVHYHTSRRGALTAVKQLRRMGVRAEAFHADLSKMRQVTRLARQVERQLGPINLLVNNAANFIRAPLEKLREGDWDESLDTNLKGPFFLAREIGLLMKQRGGGVIINIADWAGLRPYRNYLPYSISKAGVITMTKGLGRVLSPKVRVAALAPRRLRSFRPLAEAVIRLTTSRRVKTGATYSVDGKRLVG